MYSTVRNDRLHNKIGTARMEGIRKRGREREIWTDEAEEDMTIMRGRNGRSRGGFYCKAKYTKDCSA